MTRLGIDNEDDQPVVGGLPLHEIGCASGEIAQGRVQLTARHPGADLANYGREWHMTPAAYRVQSTILLAFALNLTVISAIALGGDGTRAPNDQHNGDCKVTRHAIRPEPRRLNLA
ncbi:MAG: hypothetical protein CGW95_07300 [Phenylobacterium zucineum]|nr:MAG: hypothetical protein CGW95_07300 [Phenylobacterium zucineum]